MRRRIAFGLAVALSGGFAAARVATAAEPALVVLVIDTSGSVGRPGLERGRALAGGLLDALGGTAEIAVFTFDDEARLLLPRTSAVADVERALGAARTGGRRTALFDALYDAARYVREGPAATGAIVLLTDGRDTGSALDLGDALEVAEEGHIRVFTVGIGRADEKVLRRLAKLTGGDYVGAASAHAATMAARIRALLPAAPAATTAVVPPPAAPSARSPAGARAAPSTPAGATRPPSSARAWRWAGAALALAALVLAGAWIGRRRPGDAPKPGPAPDSLPDSSPTVLARLDLTEEYLDRTVALRERPVLNVTRGAGTGRTFELSHAASLSVGRARANDVVLEDVAVSSQHCRIRPANGGFVVHDLQSTNGTFVNDRRVSHHPLAEGDVIQVGETCLQYRREHRRA
jgi:hypothetical protein